MTTKSLYLLNTGAIFVNIFNLWLIELADAEATDTESQL